MKVCIVTVYNSINSGSFWQAYALGNYISKNGCEVYFYKRGKKGTSSSFNHKLIVLLSSCKHYGLKSLLLCLRKNKRFKKYEKKFKTINKTQLNDINLYIFGSDTIWNLDDKYFYSNRNTYLGKFVMGQRKISYAASIANTKDNTFDSIKDLSQLLDDFEKISVRDSYSKNIISNYTGKNVQTVCDPTLLLTKEDYKQFLLKPQNSDYIFIYLFQDLNKEQIEIITSFAKKNNLKIISGTNNYNWCNECIVNDPYNFITYMYYSKFVVTDTFHGTIFSINFNKKFIVINRNKNKIIEVLNKYDLDSQLVRNNDIDTHLLKDIDYKEINKKINNSRNKSKRFIDDSLWR